MDAEILTGLYVSEFKALRSINTRIEPLTIVIGGNGTGKTSLLQSIIHTKDLLGSGTEAQQLATKSTNQYFHIQCPHIVISKNSRANSSPSDPGDALMIEHLGAHIKYSHMMTPAAPDCDGWVKVGSEDVILRTFAGVLRNIGYFRLESEMLTRADYSEDLRPTISSNGIGIASTLTQLQLEGHENYLRLNEMVSEVVPQFRRVRARRAKVNRQVETLVEIAGKSHAFPEEKEYAGYELIFDMANVKDLPARFVSEGTLLVLGLLTIILGPNKQRILLLDDIDRGLHPVAQGRLMELLRKLVNEIPGLQIIATTHSPEVVAHMKPEEVLVLALDDEGYSHCARMDEHPEFERWKDEMNPGEFWSVFGEDWVTKKDKADE